MSLYSYRTAGDTETKTMSGKKSDARIVSRLRHDTLFLTLPAARREELRAMIGWELASHYPGNPDDTAVSWRSERCGTEHRVTVWLMPKERLAMFGGGSDRMPALPGLALALQALGRVENGETKDPARSGVSGLHRDRETRAGRSGVLGRDRDRPD